MQGRFQDKAGAFQNVGKTLIFLEDLMMNGYTAYCHTDKYEQFARVNLAGRYPPRKLPLEKMSKLALTRTPDPIRLGRITTHLTNDMGTRPLEFSSGTAAVAAHFSLNITHRFG